MVDEIEQEPWEGQRIAAAAAFADRCRELCASNPYGAQIPAPLEIMINDLMTELWDRGFSQTEIRTAFASAIEDLPRYAAGEERNAIALGLKSGD
jgi:hypothetical protein